MARITVKFQLIGEFPEYVVDVGGRVVAWIVGPVGGDFAVDWAGDFYGAFDWKYTDFNAAFAAVIKDLGGQRCGVLSQEVRK
jgi:hypothetical protein